MEPPSPGFVEFLDRAKGTLPEVIAQTDLDTLNKGLDFLFGHLRQARQQFEGGDGRHAAYTALGAMSRFIMLFNTSLAEGLHMPIVHLQSALADLENNFVSPVPHSGRPPS